MTESKQSLNLQLNASDKEHLDSLLVKVFKNASTRVRTLKLTTEDTPTQFYFKGFVIPNFFELSVISGVERYIPRANYVKGLAADLTEIATILGVPADKKEVTDILLSMDLSHSLTPVISNLIYAYTNTKNMKDNGALVIRTTPDLGSRIHRALADK